MKNRIMYMLLCVILLLTSIPFGNVHAEEINEKWNVNPGRYIGNVATFNIDDWSNYHVFYDPAVYEDECWDDDNYWIYNEQLGTDEIPDDDIQLVITNYYYDEVREYLWYRVKAAPGYELPEKLKNNPYIMHLDSPDVAPSLIIADSGKNYIRDGGSNIITSVSLPLYEKILLEGYSTLQGKVDYQWQILADGQWIDIYGEDEAELTVSAGMIATVLDENLQAKVRVVTESGSKMVESDAITITIEPYMAGTEEAVAAYSFYTADTSIMLATEGDNIGTTSDSDGDVVNETVDITIQFVYGSNGETVAADRIYNVQKNSTLTDTFTLPVMEGYSAYLEDDTQTSYTAYDLSIDNVEQDMIITFKYWPAKVNYTVIYYWQNTEDDNYTEHFRYTDTDFTGNIAVVDNLKFEGFYQLLYEEVPLASDGSTVVEVYYDRLYYKMLFNLDGGYGVQPIYARYGTEIDLPAPTKAGYYFVGWDDVTDGEGDGIQDTLPDTIPAHHSAYKAIWKEDENAKVTIVYWGENANDEEYSYYDSQEIYVKPGTVLSFGTDQLVCTLTEHEHGDGCSYNCGIEPHTHSLDNGCYTLSCSETSHIHADEGCTISCSHSTHTIDCYETGEYYMSLVETTKPTNALTNVGDGIYTYVTKETTGWPGGGQQTTNVTHYYLQVGDKWYCAGGNWQGETWTYDTASITLACNHSHTDVCYTCGKTEGTHVHSLAGGCYTLTCTKTEHAHDATCYSCIEHTHDDNCYLKTDNAYMNETLWTYVKSDTVTVAADGSTVMNVYYDRTEFTLTFKETGNNGDTLGTITEKWGTDIREQFQEMCNLYTFLWSEQSSGDSPWTSYLSVMPQENRIYYQKTTSSSNTQTAYYYGQNVDGSGYDVLLYTSSVKYGSNLTVSKEEFVEIEGYTFNESLSSKTGSSFNGATFYYDRAMFTLEFNNGAGVVKTESVSYETSLGDYVFTPEQPKIYEPDSVEFAGWYLNPECTGEEFVLTEHIMPAENLLLYAKWTAVNHMVRFYTDKELVGSDSIYQQYDAIPHGNQIQDPYIPPNDPTKGQYIFVGWFYEDAQGNEQMWDFENTTVTGDTDIYARWSSNQLVKYEVKFVYKDENGVEHEIADTISGSALGGNSKTFDAKGNEQLYDDYQTGYFPTVQSHTIVMDLEDVTKNQFVFYYEKIEKVPYTVYYLDAETGKNVIDTNGKEYEPVTYTDNNKAVVTETYVKVPGYLPNTYQQTLIIDPDGVNKIIFYYTKDEVNGMYVVHYMTENLDGTYSEHAIFEGRVEKGSIVTATIKEIENFTYDEDHADNVVSGEVSIENVLELYVYYDRNTYPYKVQYFEEGTNKVLLGEKKVDAVMWESIVTETAPTIDHYTLVTESPVSLQIKKDTVDPTVNIITFYYAENKVELNYKVVIGKGSILCEENEGTEVREEVKIKTGVAKGATATPAAGYKFDGWYSDEECNNLISTGLVYVPTKADDTLWKETTYYAKFVPAMADLTIERSGVSEDKDQVFVYKVQSKDASDLVIYVTVEVGEDGKGSTTIHDLPFGEYMITQENGWSWRYSDTSSSIKHDDTDGKSESRVTFDKTHDSEQWLNGHSTLLKNIFKR